MVAVQPETQMVDLMVACVTFGLATPGVRIGSAAIVAVPADGAPSAAPACAGASVASLDEPHAASTVTIPIITAAVSRARCRATRTYVSRDAFSARPCPIDYPLACRQPHDTPPTLPARVKR